MPALRIYFILLFFSGLIIAEAPEITLSQGSIILVSNHENLKSVGKTTKLKWNERVHVKAGSKCRLMIRGEIFEFGPESLFYLPIPKRSKVEIHFLEGTLQCKLKNPNDIQLVTPNGRVAMSRGKIEFQQKLGKTHIDFQMGENLRCSTAHEIQVLKSGQKATLTSNKTIKLK